MAVRLTVAMLAASLATCGANASSIWYVNSGATGIADGAAWDTAFVEVQAALAVAEAGDEIRVAGGVYTPDYDPQSGTYTTDRLASFNIISGVRIYGGYAGSGDDPDARDTQLYPSILSGDLLGDDEAGFVNGTDNAFHVVTASDTDASTLLDGLVISGGYADGHVEAAQCFGGFNSGDPCDDDSDCPPAHPCVSLSSNGAGLVAFNGKLTLQDCVIRDNFAAFQGGGMLLKQASDLIMRSCTFSNNRALDNGGALYCGQSSPIMVDCGFLGNSGHKYAGAVCNRDHSNAMFLNCLFEDNTAAEELSTGGGAIVNAASSPFIYGCTFRNNHSFEGNGGALYNKFGFNPVLGGSHPLVVDCVFEDNTAALTGGAVYSDGSNGTFRDCQFTDNEALIEGGGAMWLIGAQTKVQHSEFRGNVGFNGGAIYNIDSARTLVSDCLFDGNHAVNDNGGGMSNVLSDPIVERCEFYNNTATGVQSFVTGGGASSYLSNPTFRDCIFAGNFAEYGGGGMYAEFDDGFMYVDRCWFYGNTSANGGGMFNFLASPHVSNSVFSTNTATVWGGAMLNDFQSSPEIRQCTIVYNTAEAGGGLNNASFIGEPVVNNCILWGNSPEQMTDDTETPATVTFCNVQGGWDSDVSNMSEDPVFVNTNLGDFRLSPASPCIDAGDPSYAGGPMDQDIAGHNRVSAGRQGLAVIDMGAYEYASLCFGDLDGNGDVSLGDLTLLLTSWGPTEGRATPADLDQSGHVDATDLELLMEQWGCVD